MQNGREHNQCGQLSASERQARIIDATTCADPRGVDVQVQLANAEQNELGIWVFWYSGPVDGECLRDGGEPSPDICGMHLLWIEWLASLVDVESGDAFGVTYSNWGTCKWRVQASPRFKPLWTDGAQFVTLSQLAELTRLAPLEREELAHLMTLADAARESGPANGGE